MTAPLPPPDLASRDPVLITLEAGEILHRFFTATYDPIHFDRSRDGRLNAPDGLYGVLYTAKDARGAFAETFLREPGRTLIPSDLLARKAYVRLRVTRPFVLIKLGGAVWPDWERQRRSCMAVFRMTSRKPGQRLYATTPSARAESPIMPVMMTRPFAMHSMTMNRQL